MSAPRLFPASTALLFGAAALIHAILATPLVSRVDHAILLALRTPADRAIPIGPHVLIQMMTDITSLGGGTLLTLLTLLVAGFLLLRGDGRRGAALLAIVIVGGRLVDIVKFLADRARPQIVAHLVPVDSASFPSAHSANSMIVYVGLAALLTAGSSPALRRYGFAVAFLLTALIGFSRLYLGVHWPSDVLGGWAIGAAWLCFCMIFRRRFLPD